MPERPKTFAISDPASFDGDSYEVAERSMRQAGAVAGLLMETLQGARKMVRNAELERQIHANGEADALAFDASPQGRTLDAMIIDAENAIKRCAILARAAAYDPKHPPKK